MDNENNIKGVGLKALFTEYVKPDASRKEQTSSKLDEMFRNIWAKLDKQEKDITEGGKKLSTKKKKKGIHSIQMEQTPTVEKNVPTKESNVEMDEMTK